MRFADERFGNLHLYFGHPYLASRMSTVLGLKKKKLNEVFRCNTNTDAAHLKMSKIVLFSFPYACNGTKSPQFIDPLALTRCPIQKNNRGERKHVLLRENFPFPIQPSVSRQGSQTTSEGVCVCLCVCMLQKSSIFGGSFFRKCQHTRHISTVSAANLN